MTATEQLRRQFNAEDGSFLLLVRCDLEWDWHAFDELKTAMYKDVCAKNRMAYQSYMYINEIDHIW